MTLFLPAPLEHQTPVLESPARFKVWRAGRRTGKSRAEFIAGVAGHGPERIRRGVMQGGAVAWFAPDYKQAQAIWREEIRPRFGGLGWADVSETEKRVAVPNGGWLQLLSAENIDAARGWKLDGAICDEGAYWDLEYGWNAVIRPALADKQGWAFFGSTTNAGHDGNQAKRVPSFFNMLCERIDKGELHEPDWAQFHNRTDDNLTIPRSEIAALRAEYPSDSATALQEFDAALGVAGGRYYQVDRRVHLVPPIARQPYFDYWAGFDWGFAHWAVLGAFCRDTDGNTYLLDSLWLRRMQDNEYATHIRAAVEDKQIPPQCLSMVYAGHDCWAKPTARGASGISTYDVFMQHGILLRKADIDRANGGRAVRRELAAPSLYICDTPGNRRVLEQLESIIPDENDINAPMKVDAEEGRGGDDGCLEGNTLVITDEGPRRIYDLVGKSGKCLTPVGWRGYHSVRLTRQAAPIVAVHTDVGRVIGTPDHRVLTPTGWVQLGDLREGDEWCVARASDHQCDGAGVSGEAVLAEQWRLLPPSNALSASRGVRSELWADSEGPSDPPSRREQGEQSPVEFGTGDAEGACLTTLDAGIGSPIGGASAYGERISGGMASFRRGTGMALAERATLHEEAGEGDEVLRVLRQIVSDDVPDALPILSPELQAAAETSRERGRCARVRSVTLAGIADTYDLEVEDVHCFAVQGGLVVHNSDMLRYGIASKRRVPEKPIDELDDNYPISPAVHQAEYMRQIKQDPERRRRQREELLDPNFGEW